MAHNPFQTLGLPERLDLTESAVERAYLARIAASHPDLTAGLDPDEQDRMAAALNDAKAELLDPERRAEALLALRGGPGKSEDKSLPQGFLMNILEVRETMESDLAADPAAARAAWKAWGSARRAEHVAAIGPLLRAGAGPAELRAARAILNQWRYTERLLERLDDGGGSGGGA